MSELTAAEAGQHSFINAQAWAEMNADILCCFNPEKVNSALLAYFQTKKRETDPIEMHELCQAFVHLVDRKVITPEFSFVGIPQDQLNNMRETIAPRAVAPAPAAPAPPRITPADARAAEIAECVQDFAEMDSARFKSKWMGRRRSIYDTAVAAGRI